jgi:hypothetical protein
MEGNCQQVVHVPALIPDAPARVPTTPFQNHKSTQRINLLIEESLAIEAEAAKEAGALGFMAHALAQATMPHKRTDELRFTRTNGAFQLTVTALARYGLPYGAIPRLLVAWLTTEAVRTRSRELVLGDSLSKFMRGLDLVPTGGRWGSITRLRDQMQRLFSAAVTATYVDANREMGTNYLMAEKYNMWWQPREPDQVALWESTLTLSGAFFEEAIHSPVPVDMRALKVLRRVPMALDIYVWLTYRMSYLRRRTVIPWEALRLQFGAEYDRLVDFRVNFKKQLKMVLLVYPDAKAIPTDSSLELRPSRPHIRKK